MTAYRSPGITFHRESFDPMKIMTVRHTLMGHPLLELSQLTELAKRLKSRGLVRAHTGDATMATNFTTAPETHPVALTPEETIRQIEKANTWMALHNIQNDPLYRTLVDEVLDFVRPMVDERDPGMCHRAGWIFITSPNAVTPYHMDHEHNFILQVLGEKTLHVWDPLDRDVVTEKSLELFHAKLSRELVVYRDDFAPKAHVFELQPGMGGYMPTTAPHAVKNGNNVSITVSFTYYTDATRRRKLLHRGNYELRRLGLTPTPVGESAVRDQAKYLAFRTQQNVKSMVRGARGVAMPRDNIPYAEV